jgi:FkbM family methyltransferase
MSGEKNFLNYDIGGITLILPADHKLPIWQSDHPKYDKFVPFLVKKLPIGAGVLDIGANCGDTIASMVTANPQLQYHAVEPSDNFYKYLEDNIAKIKESFPATLITYSKNLIGNTPGKYFLVEQEGCTASAVEINKAPSENEIKPTVLNKIKLSLLVEKLHKSFNLKFIKIDTDGWDYDVIDSGLEIINQFKPILFFECDPRSEKACASYQATFRQLHNTGYTHFYIFDNFGGYIFSTTDLSTLSALMFYCFREQATRTIYYIDILAITQTDLTFTASVIEEFRQQNFKKPDHR